MNQNKKREEKKYLILEDNLGKNENYNNNIFLEMFPCPLGKEIKQFFGDNLKMNN